MPDLPICTYIHVPRREARRYGVEEHSANERYNLLFALAEGAVFGAGVSEVDLPRDTQLLVVNRYLPYGQGEPSLNK